MRGLVVLVLRGRARERGDSRYHERRGECVLLLSGGIEGVGGEHLFFLLLEEVDWDVELERVLQDFSVRYDDSIKICQEVLEFQAKQI